MANGLKKQKQKWKALAKHKSSLVLYLITILAAAITGFIAKENVVGTIATCFAITNFIDTDELALVWQMVFHI